MPYQFHMMKDSLRMTLSDFGLDKFFQCGQMVMGYEKENHVCERHGGVQVEWRKVK